MKPAIEPAIPHVILLDSGPLGLITNPKASPEALACRKWARERREAGDLILVPEIADYELRRELLYDKANGRRNLDALKATGYVPLSTPAVLAAARFWAEARRSGLPTTDKLALDADVLLAGQAATLEPAEWGVPGAEVVIATGNVGHLARFTVARHWRDIAI